MSDNTTIARPYAKAVFQYALAHKQLADWSATLSNLAQIVLNADVLRFITNPASTAELQKQLIMTVFSPAKQRASISSVENFVSLLAANKRLLLLPDICTQFEMLRAEQEKTLTVNVTSFAPLSGTQEAQLIKRLSHRLQRQVTLEVNIDEALLGGAVIRAGDLVIDGSVRGKLTKLGTDLAA
jgi:F-type H+-transporting ATPase subunit delta